MPEPKTPAHATPSEPPLVRKKGDREPPPEPRVGSGVTPVVNGTPRGGDSGEHS
jgi:hypothetical protein